MPLLQLEHYLVLSDDIDATRDFYCAALGMRQGPRPPLDFPGYWVYLREVPCIHIADWSGYRAYAEAIGIGMSTRAAGTGPVDHIAFSAVDYVSVKARLRGAGVAAAENLVPGIGLRQLFLLDPNGVKIEINIPAEPPSQPDVDRL
jgi:catechol 2,3-dioxygenase-like lactoylglutathione lyase family enzyme